MATDFSKYKLPDQTPPTQDPPKRNWAGEILPIGGSILGGILGAAGGAFVGAPTVVGAPLAGYAGGVAGAGIGGALGETAQQYIEKLTGKRQHISGGEIAKTGVEQAAIEAIAGPVSEVAAGALKGGGKFLAESVIPTSAKEAKLIQAYKAGTPFWDRVLAGFGKEAEAKAPTTAAKTAFDKGLAGTESMIGVQAKRASTNLWDNMISPALKNSTTKVDMKSLFDEARAQIIRENPEISRQKSLLEALDAMKGDYKGVKSINLEQLQKFKEGWAQFVPDKAYKGKPIAGAFRDVQDTMAGLARTKIYGSLGDGVKQAYFDYGNLKGLQELGQKAMTGAGLKGGAGSWINTVKEMAVVPIGTVGGQTLYKVGQGVELLGSPGARVVRDVIPAFFETGKDISGQQNASVPAVPPTSGLTADALSQYKIPSPTEIQNQLQK